MNDASSHDATSHDASSKPVTTTKSSSLPFSLLIIVDDARASLAGKDALTQVRRTLESPHAAALAILIRRKNAPVSSTIDAVRALLPDVTARAATLLVHAHAHLVSDEGAHGVHLPGNDDPVRARHIVGEHALVGWSRHASDDVKTDARLAACSYVTLSPVFSPRSKPDDARAPLGLDGFQTQATNARVPVIGLGGISLANAGAVFEHGASAVAVVDIVMSSDDPARDVTELFAAFTRPRTDDS